MANVVQYAPWISDIELAFYSALSNLKINHDKLDSSARRVLGLYELQNRDAPNRSTRMQLHGTALTSDECVVPLLVLRGVAKRHAVFLTGSIEEKALFATSTRSRSIEL